MEIKMSGKLVVNFSMKFEWNGGWGPVSRPEGRAEFH